MTNWQEFYQALPKQSPDQSATNWVCWLEHQAIYRVSGDDAGKFLHSQLSNDVERLALGEVRRAAYCSAKGRMLASLIYWREQDDLLVQCHASLADALIKRLSMFVLRAKVKFERVTDHVLLGFSGAASEALLSAHFAELPGLNQVCTNSTGTLMRLADSAAAPRYACLLTQELAQQLLPTFAQQLSLCQASRWELSDIQAGIAEVSAATQDHFVPQMINFELIGGVNFKKGCYPGQEVVARSQYLGKLKRRMFIAKTSAATSAEFTAGAAIYNAAEPEQACGELVALQIADAQNAYALLQIRLLDHEANQLRLGSAQGPALELLELPYAISDITA